LPAWRRPAQTGLGLKFKLFADEAFTFTSPDRQLLARYLVIGLSFDAQGEDKPAPWIEDWRCLYDLKTGAFSIPAAFAGPNAKAFKTPRLRRR
jgi:hypothetical protein